MINHKPNGHSKQKRVYVKPEVKQVQLRPEEAVLGACKQLGQGGPSGWGCTGVPTKCHALGS